MARSTRRFADLAKLFKTLSDESRLRILNELQAGPCNVRALVRKLRIPQPSVSHHLALLRMEELVVARRSGKSVIYSIQARQIRSEKAFRRLLGPSTGLRLGNLLLGLAGT